MPKYFPIALPLILLASLSLSLLPASARDLQLEAGYQLLDVAHLTMQEDTVQSTFAQQADDLHWTQSAHLADGGNLTLRVMHRDSPSSPFRNSQATAQQLMNERLKRDAARVEALTRRTQMAAEGVKNSDLSVETASYTTKQDAIDDFSGPVVSGLTQGSGEYFTRIGVGTPARQSFMILDTGSDILWIQCSPCVDCYPQTDPVFNPTDSSSFRRLACTSHICSMLELHACQSRTNRCLYQASYGDGSFSTGEFSRETLSFRGATLKNVALGCGHDNEGLFVGAAGLLGLGGGPLSFPSQLGVHFAKKFSYCLVDRDQQGYSSLIFGSSAIPRGTVFTPLLKNPKLETFYYVSLMGISVGGNLLNIPASAFKMTKSGNGGVIIDSGTSVTRLVESAYGRLRSAFKAATRSLPPAGGISILDTCYDLSGKTYVKVPTVVLHFGHGADMALPASNYLIRMDNAGTFCLSFASTAGELSIIGNVQQQGFRIAFDRKASRVGFAANQC